MTSTRTKTTGTQHVRSLSEPEMQDFQDEWLVRRGNYLTTITPELAEALLERNSNNRRPKERAIAQYARDMAAGKWDADASDIKFARTGELIDGQNRLTACVRAGKPFPTLVRTGLSLKAKAHVDTGVKRSVADMLKMEGISGRPSTVGAAVSLWVRYEDRVANHRGKRLSNASGGGQSTKPGVTALTHEEILVFLDAHPTIDRLSLHAESLRQSVMPAIPASSVLTWVAMCAEKDEDLIHQVMDRLKNAQFEGPDDPLPALVQYAAMVRGRRIDMGTGGHRGRVLQESALLAMIRVWNALRTDTKLEGRLHIKITDTLVLPQ